MKTEVEAAKLLKGIGFNLKDVIGGISTLEISERKIFDIKTGDQVTTSEGLVLVTGVDNLNLTFTGRDREGVQGTYNFEHIIKKI